MKKHPAITISLGIITTLLVPLVLGGEDSMIPNAMVQAGWCPSGNSICFLSQYVMIVFSILLVGIISQVILDRKTKNSIAVKEGDNQKTREDHQSEKTVLTYRQKQIQAINEVSLLVNDAVEKSLMFSEGVAYQSDPSLKEQCVIARNSGKALMEYYKRGNNRQYFSDGARKNIVDIYETISVCTQKMFVAIEGRYYPDLWDEYSEKLKNIKPLRDKLDSEFHKFLVNFDEN